MALKYHNAQEAFPPEIVEEIQKYYPGGYLWIPKPEAEEFAEVAISKSER